MLPQFFLSYPLVPGETAVDGIKFDFCDGVRILFPRGLGEHRVILTDLDSGVVVQNTHCCDGAKFRSELRYYVNWQIDIWRESEKVFTHRMDLRDKEVLFTMNTDAIGDTIAWFPYVERFQRIHKCKAGIIMWRKLRELLEPNYPNVRFFDRGTEKILEPYASYLLGINYECNHKMQKRSFNSIGLAELVGCDLGFDNELEVQPPEIATLDEPLLKGKYVCFAVLGSCENKCWHNKAAIAETVAWLKSKGYRVLMVDKENRGLYGAEDWTGDRPLIERATLFKHASCAVCVSSGLSWMANACGCKVVLVSGFTEPWVEFRTPYRVQNANVCHGCWNDVRRNHCGECFENLDYECSRSITSKMVIRELALALGEEK